MNFPLLTHIPHVDSQIASSKSSFSLKFNSAIWILTTGVQFVVGWWYRRQPVFYLPEGWFGPLAWWLAFPFAPAGESFNFIRLFWCFCFMRRGGEMLGGMSFFHFIFVCRSAPLVTCRLLAFALLSLALVLWVLWNSVHVVLRVVVDNKVDLEFPIVPIRSFSFVSCEAFDIQTCRFSGLALISMSSPCSARRYYPCLRYCCAYTSLMLPKPSLTFPLSSRHISYRIALTHPFFFPEQAR